MAKLILFWGEKEDLTFTWRLDSQQANDANRQTNSTDQESVMQGYQLQSDEILKSDLVCLADMAETHSVSLILSCKDVMSTQVEVPNKAQRLLRKAVPYMLEDEVINPVDELFFAFADKSKDALLPIRVIERQYLQQLIDMFNQSEIKLSEILVDLDLIALPEEGMKVLVSESQCLTVGADNKRWHCHPDDFSWLIQKQINSDDVDEDLPVAIPLDIYSQEATDRFEHQLPVGRFATQSIQLDDPFDFLIKQGGKTVNLLQAEFEPKKENSEITQFLFKVASIIGFVLVTHLIYQGVNIYSLSEQKSQLIAQQTTLYKQAFPRVKKVRNPFNEMRAKVKLLGGSTSGGDFLSLLSSSSQHLTDLTKIYPTNISFDQSRNELRMDVIASDLVTLDQFADALKKTGHQVEKSSETQRGDGYSSRLTIKK